MICTEDGCQAPATARVADPQLPYRGPMGFVIVRPLATANPIGRVVCADHAHLAVDMVLMHALPGGRP